MQTKSFRSLATEVIGNTNCNSNITLHVPPLLDHGLDCYLTEKHSSSYFLSPFLLSLFPVQELTDLIRYVCVGTLVHKLFGFFVLPSSGHYKKTAMIGNKEFPMMICNQAPRMHCFGVSHLVDDELVVFGNPAFFFPFFSGQATWCIFPFRKSISHFPAALSLRKTWHGISAE